MARLPKNPAEAIAELRVAEGETVLAFAPSNGYVEALASAVGDAGRIVVSDPPPELQPPSNATVVDAVDPETSADAVLVWLGPVPAHTIREYPARVRDGGALWVVFPKTARGKPNPVHEADVRRALLVGGWLQDRVVQLSTDHVAVRFRKRRAS